MKEIPGSFLEDVVKVFLLGINKEFKDQDGNPIPNVIRCFYDFEYEASWSTLIQLRKDITKNLRSRKDKKLNLLAAAIELIHEDD